MSDANHIEPAAAPTERTGPLAGIVSAAFHAAALILAALLWNDTPAGMVEERPRNVGIRLVSAESFRPDAVAEAAVESEPNEAAATDAGSEADLAAALPSSAASASLPELDPQRDAAGGAPAFADLPGFGDAGAGRSAFPGTAEGDAELIAEERARIAAGRPQGNLSNVSLFGGAASTGRTFVFAIDRSHSMGAEGIGAIDAAVGELSNAVAGLDRTNRFQVVAYNRDLVFLDGERKLLPKTPESAEKTKRFVDSIAAFGPTEHRRALLSALALSPEVIYLLTDGGDPALTDAEVAQVARIAGSKTTVHVVCFGRKEMGSAAKSLQALAEACRGSFTFVDLSKKR
ncbi:MAG TPA: hypothetical protein VGN57_11085 [Pirellulaceae bacterium]|nr:hypothetical protein [Pirellulaceae bacterium]